MEQELFDSILKVSNKSSIAVELIQTGISVLYNKPIDKHLKKELLKRVLERIALGRDNIKGTDDDVLSQRTLNLLITLLDSEMIDTIIDGVVSNYNKTTFTKIQTCFGTVLRRKL
jgi:hypothetical protein